MYKIIGADGHLYGPVSAEQLRQWVAEGRANAQTLVQVEGSVEWKPLISLPEFASFVAGPVPPSVSPAGGKSKIAAGLLAILLAGLGAHRFYLGYHGIGATQLALWLVGIPLGCVTCGVGYLLSVAAWIWCLVEGIMILTGSINRDATGRPLSD